MAVRGVERGGRQGSKKCPGSPVASKTFFKKIGGGGAAHGGLPAVLAAADAAAAPTATLAIRESVYNIHVLYNIYIYTVLYNIHRLSI